MKKRTLFLLSILTVLILFNPCVYGVKYQDTRGHWAENYIDELSDSGFITGYEENRFNPDNLISKAEFFSIINSMANLKKTYTVTFTDVNSSDWFYNDISKALKAGYIVPTTGKLNPNKSISRSEVMYILGYMYKLKPEVEYAKKFKDTKSLNYETLGYVGALVKLSFLDGNQDYLRVNDGISRAEICKLICLLMDEFGLPGERTVPDSKIRFGDRNLYD